MLFTSDAYIFFLLTVSLIYWVCPANAIRNGVLLTASYVFYGLHIPKYLVILLFYTIFNFIFALMIEDWGRVRKILVRVECSLHSPLFASGGGRHIVSRLRQGGAFAVSLLSRLTSGQILTCGIVGNLALLVVYKYLDFFIGDVNALLSAAGLHFNVKILGLILPLGISFFSFQAIAYLVDVYRRTVPACRDLVQFALFKAFFPQLVAGPIERLGHMLPQFGTPRRFTANNLREGLYFILLGLFLKCMIADRLASFVDYQFINIPNVDRTPEAALWAVVAFTIQIYGDFAGYTYIALGSARLFGFELSRNFLAPYLATSIQDFWRRWHVTLSQWLRDYLYVPLGGSRGGPGRTALNLLLTMVLGGLWHGANWTFVLWGGYHGMALVIHRFIQPWLRHTPRPLLSVIGWAVTLPVVMLGWAIFRSSDMPSLLSLLDRIFRVDVLKLIGAPEAGPIVAMFGLVLLVQRIEETRSSKTVLERLPSGVQAILLSALALSVTAIGFQKQKFIYFQF